MVILKCENNQPEIVSLHQCLGNAEEEKMVLNEEQMVNTFGCMIEST